MKYTDAYFKSKSVRFVEMTKDFDLNQERDLLKILLNFTSVSGTFILVPNIFNETNRCL